MNISLPDTLKSFVDEQVSQGGYGTTSECLHELMAWHAGPTTMDDRDRRPLTFIPESMGPSWP